MNEVDAVKTKEDIEAVEALLRKYHGNIYADIWCIGLNLGLRTNELLALTFSDMNIPNRTFSIKKNKTGIKQSFVLNSVVLQIIERRKKEYPNDHYLFQAKSNRTKTKLIKPVSRISVSRTFKDVGEILGLNINTLSMRKSCMWAMYSDGESTEKIRNILNHSSKEMTLHYIGITK